MMFMNGVQAMGRVVRGAPRFDRAGTRSRVFATGLVQEQCFSLCLTRSLTAEQHKLHKHSVRLWDQSRTRDLCSATTLAKRGE